MEYQDFKLRLEQQLVQLRSEISKALSAGDRTSAKLEVALLSNDQLIDLATAAELKELKQPLKTLKRVDAALCQFELELYGICSDCEDEIQLERLQRDPTTQRCQACSEKYAAKSKGKPSFAL